MSIFVRIIVEGINVDVKVNKDTNYRVLKEYLRDTLSPMLHNPNQNWGRIIEMIRDTAIPVLLAE